MEQLSALQEVLDEMRVNATMKSACDQEIALYLACSFSFEAGNASRPDITDNITMSEFLGWKDVFKNTPVDDPVPHLRVYSHKTNHLYGCAKICIERDTAELLSSFGTKCVAKEIVPIATRPYLAVSGSQRVKFVDVSPKMFKTFFKQGFSQMWSVIRKRNPAIANLHNTAFRFCIETMVSRLIR